MEDLLRNISNVPLKDMPKFIALESNISEMTLMCLDKKSRLSEIYYIWDIESNSLVKHVKNKSLKTKSESEKETSFKIKFDVVEGMFPFKELVKRLKAHIKADYNFVNLKQNEAEFTLKRNPFKNILNYTTSDFNLEDEDDNVVYYSLCGIDPRKMKYREMPIENDVYSHVCGFQLNGVFSVFDLKYKPHRPFIGNFHKRFSDLKVMDSLSRWEVLDMKSVMGPIPHNVEKIEGFDQVDQGTSGSCIIIGPCIEGKIEYYYMYKIHSLFPTITLSGNSKGLEIKSGTSCYIGFMGEGGVEIKVRTSIKAIFKNYKDILGLKALIYYTNLDLDGKEYFVQSVNNENVTYTPG